MEDGKAAASLVMFTMVNLTNRISRATGRPSRWEHKHQFKLEAPVQSEGEISLSALRCAQDYLDRLTEESISSPWGDPEEELPPTISSPLSDRGEAPSDNWSYSIF